MGRNLCLVARHMIECDEGYWSSGLKDDDEDAEPHYCYMASNNPPGRSIIPQVRSMITDNNFDLSVCELYLNQIQLDVTIIYKAYESSVEVSVKLDSELTRLRL